MVSIESTEIEDQECESTGHLIKAHSSKFRVHTNMGECRSDKSAEQGWGSQTGWLGASSDKSQTKYISINLTNGQL